METERDPARDPDRWRAAVAPRAAERLVDAIDALADFPVLDGTVTRVIAIADDPEANTTDLVAVLEADPTFAANLLRLASSAAMARPIRAQTIRQAVMLVGRKALRRLALEAATYRFLELAPGSGGARRGELHLHAVSVAAVSAAAAEAAGVPAELPHLAGLLHDIGKLVLPIAFGEAACDEVLASAPEGPHRVVAERERFGIDHAFAGALLADRWGVPAEVAAAIAWHHGGPSGVGCPSAEVACVQIANEVAHFVVGREPDHPLLEVALERTGLAPAVLDTLAGHALPSSGPELEPGAFARRVTELDGLSQTDELTGVDNRRHWLQATRAALAETSGDEGALLVCDVDDLAAVNATHGPRTGDAVLTEVGRVLARHGRTGRLAGDAFAVWLRAPAAAAEEAAAGVPEELAAALGTRADGAQARVGLGLAAARTHGRDLAVLLEAAEADLRGAKEHRGAPSASAHGAGPAAPATAPRYGVLARAS